MKTATLAQIQRTVYHYMNGDQGLSNHNPNPFPGKLHPVRVAWRFTMRERQVPDRKGNRMVPENPGERFLSYIGKPNRYRALEALRWLSHPPAGWRVTAFWQAEFDRGGIIAWTSAGLGHTTYTNAYHAYHPQLETNSDICQQFAKAYYVKRIGKVPTYSFQAKLSQAQVQRYYDWWQQTFVKKLERPTKSRPRQPNPVPPPPEFEELVQEAWQPPQDNNARDFYRGEDGNNYRGFRTEDGHVVLNDPPYSPLENQAMAAVGEIARRRNARRVGARFYLDARGRILRLEPERNL